MFGGHRETSTQHSLQPILRSLRARSYLPRTDPISSPKEPSSPDPRAPPPTACMGGCCRAWYCWVSATPHRGLALGMSPDAAVRHHHRPRNTGRTGRHRVQPGSEGVPSPYPPRPRLHLSPGRGIPAEAGLGPTKLTGGWLGRPRLAVEGPQRPEVPLVHTLYIPCRGTSTTVARALETKEHRCRHSLNPCMQYDPVRFVVQQGVDLPA